YVFLRNILAPLPGLPFYYLFCLSGVHLLATKIRLLAGSLFIFASDGFVQADARQPDPSWHQWTLANGSLWHVLATPQRPS
ncbi:hypothetical protein AIZ23_24345, partial [Salmonella enterica subsp. enterica serovar Typhimurium]